MVLGYTYNATCHTAKPPNNPAPIFQNGKLNLQIHVIGWLVAGLFTLVATITALWLVSMHLRWYTNKKEQRYIVRILFMVPIYAIVSFASFLFWNESTPILLVRDCYESTVLTSFFYLLLLYISPNPDEQRNVFRKHGLSKENDREAKRLGKPIAKWMYPISFLRSKPADGIYFLQIMKWGVLQYCVVRPCTTLAAVILDYVGLYCEGSWSPGWGYPYITVIVSVSVSVAMYCLLQMYMPVKHILAPHKPMLKLIAVKSVVFLTFWQGTLLSFLGTFGLVKDTPTMTADDIEIAIGALIETFEMMLFAFFYVKAFSYKPYSPLYTPELGILPLPTSRLKSLGHALDFRETLRELWIGCIYVIRRWQGREAEVDVVARRMAVLEAVNGRPRYKGIQAHEKVGSKDSRRAVVEKPKPYKLGVDGVVVEVEEHVHVDSPQPWLADYLYGVNSARGPGLRNADFTEPELEKEEYPRLDSPPPEANSTIVSSLLAGGAGHHTDGQCRSWWRNIYERISTSSKDDEVDRERLEDAHLTVLPQRRQRRTLRNGRLSRSASCVDELGVVPIHEERYDDPPPQSIMRTYRSEKDRRGSTTSTAGERKSKENRSQRRHDVETQDGSRSKLKQEDPGPSHIQAPSSRSERERSAPRPRRSDDVLARVFPHPPSDAGTSSAGDRTSIATSQRTHATSSQAHSAPIHLAGPPVVVPQQAVRVHTPTLTEQLQPPTDHHVAQVPERGRTKATSRITAKPTLPTPPLSRGDAYTDSKLALGVPESPISMLQDRYPVASMLTPPTSPPRTTSPPSPVGPSVPSRRKRENPIDTHRRHELYPHLAARPRIVLPAPLAPAARPSAITTSQMPSAAALPFQAVPEDDELQLTRGRSPYPSPIHMPSPSALGLTFATPATHTQHSTHGARLSKHGRPRRHRGYDNLLNPKPASTQRSGEISWEPPNHGHQNSLHQPGASDPQVFNRLPSPLHKHQTYES